MITVKLVTEPAPTIPGWVDPGPLAARVLRAGTRSARDILREDASTAPHEWWEWEDYMLANYAARQDYRARTEYLRRDPEATCAAQARYYATHTEQIRAARNARARTRRAAAREQGS